MSRPAAASASRNSSRFLDRQVERQHAVDAGRGRLASERLEPHAQQRIGVAEDHDRRRDIAAAPSATSASDAAQTAAGGQRPLGRPLDHRAVGQRIRERHADFEDVGAGAIERLQNLGRARQVGIAGRRRR